MSQESETVQLEDLEAQKKALEDRLREAKKAAKQAEQDAKKAAKQAEQDAKKAAKQAAKQSTQAQATATPVKEVAPVKTETPAVEPVAEPVVETVAEPVTEPTVAVEPVPAPIVEVSEPIDEPAPEDIEEPAPAPVAEVIPEPVQKETATTESKLLSLHDEFKDANTDLDFYEEDVVDQEARYKGKWVICRVVTDDANSEELYFFELHASNGEKLLTSEEYTSYNGAVRGILTHKNNIAKGNFRITISKRGEYIFKLLSGKNMLLCLGEGYPTKARCESAIESTKRFAATAVIDENVQYQVVKVPVEDDTPVEPPKDGAKGKWLITCTELSEDEKVYSFELFANNGERLLSSEEYTTYIGAVNGIETHKLNIQKGNFRIVLTKRGDYVYKLLNSNGQLLCLGERYKTKRLCQNAVESVKRFAFVSPTLIDAKVSK